MPAAMIASMCVPTMPGSRTSTQGITQMEKLPKAARQYLSFLEKESGARIGIVSTGPGREQTVLVDDFARQLRSLTERNEGAGRGLTIGASNGVSGVTWMAKIGREAEVVSIF